jgi:phosphatidylserine/phosphatidylglycerophosphate/cardiolipin synthase-like enzyme
MERINHLMHNKLLVADNRAAVIGGQVLICTEIRPRFCIEK